MKNFFKGLITGVIISAASAPVAAKGIDVVFNSIRINLNGINVAQWGENYSSDNEVPYSILYKGTTYLPLKEIGNLTGKQIHWNGDTKTATLTEQLDYPTKGNVDAFSVPLAYAEDSNGYTWIYNAVKDVSGNDYIHIADYERHYSRVYNYSSGRMVNKNGIWRKSYGEITDGKLDDILVLEDGIIFVTSIDENNRQIRKISFNSSPDTQDGEVISEGEDYFLFDNLMIAYGVYEDQDGEKGIAEAINLKTGNKAVIGKGSFNGFITDAFIRIGTHPDDRAEYKDGYFYFDSYAPYVDNRHAYRVKIEFSDTPIVGEIEDLGKI